MTYVQPAPYNIHAVQFCSASLWFKGSSPNIHMWFVKTYQSAAWLMLDIVERISKLTPNSKVHGANMGTTWVLSAPDGPHVGPVNIAIRDAEACWYMYNRSDQNRIQLVLLFLVYCIFQSLSILVRYKVHTSPGPRLNVKTVFPKHGNSHVKDKTVARPSYLYHGDPWINASCCSKGPLEKINAI